MYRVYQLTDKEKDKIVRCRWVSYDGSQLRDNGE